MHTRSSRSIYTAAGTVAFATAAMAMYGYEPLLGIIAGMISIWGFLLLLFPLRWAARVSDGSLECGSPLRSFRAAIASIERVDIYGRGQGLPRVKVVTNDTDFYVPEMCIDGQWKAFVLALLHWNRRIQVVGIGVSVDGMLDQDGAGPGDRGDP